MIVAGFGFRGAAGIASLHDALVRAGGGATVSVLATVADKADSPVFRQFARELALPVHRIPQPALSGVTTRTLSPAALSARRTGSVAEAAALAAAGPGGRLVRARIVSADRMATCALADTATSELAEGDIQ